MESRRQLTPGHVKPVPAVKARSVKAPRQASPVPSPSPSAVNVVEALSLLLLVQVGVLAREYVERETPGIVATLATDASAPRLAGIEVT